MHEAFSCNRSNVLVISVLIFQIAIDKPYSFTFSATLCPFFLYQFIVAESDLVKYYSNIKENLLKHNIYTQRHSLEHTLEQGHKACVSSSDPIMRIQGF